MAELRVLRCAQNVHVFLIKTAGEIINWPTDAPYKSNTTKEFWNPLITEKIKTVLINAGHITNVDLV